MPPKAEVRVRIPSGAPLFNDLVDQSRFRGDFMTIDRRALIAAVSVSFLFASSLQAAPRHHSHHSHHSWDGTWSGHWGGSAQQATSITIANNKVVSYTYQGASTPVSTSTVTPTRVSYESNGVRVVLTRAGSRTANASLHSSHGEGTAKLTRQ